MEIIQRKSSNTHTFTFHEEHFNFAYNDNTGSDDNDFNYADFPQKASIQIEQNECVRNIGVVWLLLGTYQIGSAIYADISLSGKGFWLAIGLACILWAHFSKVIYSRYKTDRGDIYVIQGKNHDAIIQEINKRRSDQLRRWHGEFNPENELEIEIEKFKWLKDQSIITSEEAEQKIKQVREFHQEKAMLSSKKFH